MYLIVEFDLNSDLVSVPKRVAENIDVVRHSFLHWVYSPQNKKKFVKKVEGSDGQSFECICYNSEEFIDWLNKKVLQAGENKATLVEKTSTDNPAATIHPFSSESKSQSQTSIFCSD